MEACCLTAGKALGDRIPCHPFCFLATIARELVGNRSLSNRFPNYSIEINSVAFEGIGRNWWELVYWVYKKIKKTVK